MKVYLVHLYINPVGYPETVYEDTTQAIFSTREKAQRYINDFDLKKLDEDYPEDYREGFIIFEYELDRIRQ